MKSGLWIAPLLLLLAAAGSFAALHPGARSAVGDGCFRLRSALRGEDADSHHRSAERRYWNADFGKGELLCRKALILNPSHAPSLALLTELLFIQGKGAPTAHVDYSRYMIDTRPSTLRREIDLEFDAAESSGLPGDRKIEERAYRRILEYVKWLPDDDELECSRELARQGLDRLATR